MNWTETETREEAAKPILAWHFVGNTLLDGRPVPADGEWLEHDGALVMCESGLHASLRLIDALQYAPGATICRVECADGVWIDDTGAANNAPIQYEADKLVAMHRRILWRIDGEAVLRAFARWSALQVAHLWPMPAVVREYLETGDEALRAAAEAAARAAAWAASRDAAWDAARAAARAAAWDAAWDAASAAARAAAWDAARAAAWDAAWDAAWAAWAAAWAAWNAAGDEQNEQLERMVEEARRGRINWSWQAALADGVPGEQAVALATGAEEAP